MQILYEQTWRAGRKLLLRMEVKSTFGGFGALSKAYCFRVIAGI